LMLKRKLQEPRRLPVLLILTRLCLAAFIFVGLPLFPPALPLVFAADDYKRPEISQQESETQSKKPVVITAKTMDADNLSHKALFVGDVVAKSDGVTVYADRMEVFYSEETGQIIRIDYEGGVKMIKNKRAIVSDRATYYGDEEKIDFRGDPRILEGDNLVTGSVIFYYPSKDRLVVKDSRVYMHSK